MIENLFDYSEFDQLQTEKELRKINEEKVLKYLSLHINVLSDGTLPALEADEVIVLCVVKNGINYVTEFLDYYRTLGVKHFVFLDNGSTDKTLEKIVGQKDITVLETQLPYKIFFQAFKRYLIKKMAHDCWSLTVDMDEFFIYPNDDKIDLATFIKYQNLYGYNAVVTQMLDLFPNQPIAEIDTKAFEEQHIWYDNSAIEFFEFDPTQNIIANPEIRFHSGGIRKNKFEIQHDIALTKHALLRYIDGIILVNDHSIQQARVSDVSAGLKHYKYVGDFKKYVADSVAEGNHFEDSIEYRHYLKKLKKDGSFSLTDDASKTFDQVSQLVNEGFLLVTTEFENFCNGIEAAQKTDNSVIQKETDSASDLPQSNEANENLPIDFKRSINDLNRKNIGLKKQLISVEEKYEREMRNIKQSYSWRIGQFFMKPLGVLLKLIRR